MFCFVKSFEIINDRVQLFVTHKSLRNYAAFNRNFDLKFENVTVSTKYAAQKFHNTDCTYWMYELLLTQKNCCILNSIFSIEFYSTTSFIFIMNF